MRRSHSCSCPCLKQPQLKKGHGFRSLKVLNSTHSVAFYQVDEFLGKLLNSEPQVEDARKEGSKAVVRKLWLASCGLPLG